MKLMVRCKTKSLIDQKEMYPGLLALLPANLHPLPPPAGDIALPGLVPLLEAVRGRFQLLPSVQKTTFIKFEIEP